MSSGESLSEKIARVTSEEVELVPYNDLWPTLFEQEKAHLLSCLPSRLIRRIEHFGSTAVPRLAAKPIIDMLIEVTDLRATRNEIAPVLEAQGYDYFWRPTLGDDGPPFYAWFIKRDPLEKIRTHHLHLVEREFDGHWHRLLFRDYLVEFPQIAREYQNLKMALSSTAKNRIDYTRGKTEFVVEKTAEAIAYFKKRPEGR